VRSVDGANAIEDKAGERHGGGRLSTHSHGTAPKSASALDARLDTEVGREVK